MEKLKIKNGKFEAEINLRGAGLMRLKMQDEDILYGYDTDSKQAGCMGDVLFPWAGRVENSQYEFEEKKYSLKTTLNSGPNALHGFAKDQIFEIVEQTTSSVELKYSFKANDFTPLGYPFSADLSIKYELTDAGLTCSARVKNTGKENLPFGLGFHPYLKFSSLTINDLQFKVPAKKFVIFDDTLKPTGKYIPIEESPLDFSKGRDIGSTEIDNCFYDLEFTDGRAETELTGKNGKKLILWQDENFPYLQVYSADTIGEENFRKGIAIEPQTCCGYAFNIPEMGLRVLKPNEEFKGKWGIEVE